LLGHKQLAINQGTGAIMHQDSKHAHLAVIGLAQATNSIGATRQLIWNTEAATAL